LALQGKSAGPSLEAALVKARLATQSPELFPDAWQTLAETELRLARLAAQSAAGREQHISDGLAALSKGFAINPNHALGLATQGALQLLRAQAAPTPPARQAAALLARQSLERAIARDPFLRHDFAPLLAQAPALTTNP
jgi:hypothetical protein